MRYFPHTPEDITEMLNTVGVKSLEDLFGTIPVDCRRAGDLNLPQALTEWELNHHIDELCGSMAVSPEYKVFMGAGSYEHYIPVSLNHLLSRSEFVTSYTPYQPEMSQGTLQAIFEYQTLTARLLGMEVANASQYDGASALAEAALMAVRISRRKKVAVSRLVHPHYRRVLKTYLAPTDNEIIELPYLPDGTTDLSSLDALDDLAAVVVQSPNFFGCIENLKAIGDKTRAEKTLFVVGFSEPLAYGTDEKSRQPGSGYRLRRRPESGNSPLFRRTGPGDVCHPDAICAQHAGTSGGPNHRCGWQTGLRVDSGHPGTTYPSGKGHFQHLHQSQSVRSGVGHVYVLSRGFGHQNPCPLKLR